MRHVIAVVASLVLASTAATALAADPDVPWAVTKSAHLYALRLRPGADLLESLRRFARERGLAAAGVVSCAGSATRASVRYANQSSAAVREGHFEIVSLTGTLAAEGAHLHVALADSTGATFGGHLMEGTRVYTTAEIVLVELDDVAFAREPDATYGYRELVPRARAAATGR